MACSDFSAKRVTKRQSPIDVSSSALPKLPVSSSLVAVVPHTIIRSSRPQPGKFVFSDPKRVLQHYPPDSGHAATAAGGPFPAINSHCPVIRLTCRNGERGTTRLSDPPRALF